MFRVLLLAVICIAAHAQTCTQQAQTLSSQSACMVNAFDVMAEASFVTEEVDGLFHAATCDLCLGSLRNKYSAYTLVSNCPPGLLNFTISDLNTLQNGFCLQLDGQYCWPSVSRAFNTSMRFQNSLNDTGTAESRSLSTICSDPCAPALKAALSQTASTPTTLNFYSEVYAPAIDGLSLACTSVGGSSCWTSFVASAAQFDMYKSYITNPTSNDYAMAFSKICNPCMRASFKTSAATQAMYAAFAIDLYAYDLDAFCSQTESNKLCFALDPYGGDYSWTDTMCPDFGYSACSPTCVKNVTAIIRQTGCCASAFAIIGLAQSARDVKFTMSDVVDWSVNQCPTVIQQAPLLPSCSSSKVISSRPFFIDNINDVYFAAHYDAIRTALEQDLKLNCPFDVSVNITGLKHNGASVEILVSLTPLLNSDAHIVASTLFTLLTTYAVPKDRNTTLAGITKFVMPNVAIIIGDAGKLRSTLPISASVEVLPDQSNAFIVTSVNPAPAPAPASSTLLTIAVVAIAAILVLGVAVYAHRRMQATEDTHDEPARGDFVPVQTEHFEQSSGYARM